MYAVANPSQLPTSSGADVGPTPASPLLAFHPSALSESRSPTALITPPFLILQYRIVYYIHPLPKTNTLLDVNQRKGLDGGCMTAEGNKNKGNFHGIGNDPWYGTVQQKFPHRSRFPNCCTGFQNLSVEGLGGYQFEIICCIDMQPKLCLSAADLVTPCE